MLGLGAGASTSSPTESKYSLSLDGTNDYLDTGATFNSVFQGNWSVSVWVNFTDKDPSANEYVWGSEIGTEDVIRFGQLSNQTYNFYFKSNNDAADSNSWATGYSHGDDGETGWQHFVITAKNRTGSNATQIICYQNGVAKTNVIAGLTGTNHAAFTSTNLFLGARNNDGTAQYPSDSKISSFAIWNAVLDGPAVTAIYNNGIPTNLTFDSGNYDNSSALQGYWRMGNGSFDDKANGVVHDQDNPGFGAELWESPASTNGSVAKWVAYGSNSLETVNEAVQITYEDNAQGGYMYFKSTTDISTNLTVGARYKMSCDVKVNSGASVVLNISPYSGVNISSTAITSTEFVEKVMYFTAGHVSNCYLKVINMGSGEVATLDNFSLKKLNGNPGFTSGGPTFSPDTP